jgi:hypothetical protein
LRARGSQFATGSQHQRLGLKNNQKKSGRRPREQLGIVEDDAEWRDRVNESISTLPIWYENDGALGSEAADHDGRGAA